MSTEKGSCQKEQGIIRGLREGVFVIQPNPTTTQYAACEKCGTQWTPPELLCPKCQDDTQPTPAPDVIRPEFIEAMRHEIHANARKGDWTLFKIARSAAGDWLDEHATKLKDAVACGDRASVREYAADVANIAMKIEECFGLNTDDPTESEDYAKFVESMVPYCHCTGQVRPCDGVLAGGVCDELHEDNASEEEDES